MLTKVANSLTSQYTVTFARPDASAMKPVKMEARGARSCFALAAMSAADAAGPRSNVARPVLTGMAVCALAASALAARPQGGQTLHRVLPSYETYLTGDAADVRRPTRGGLQLEGGGTDIPDAFRWLVDHAGGGDIVVLRASGEDGYNTFIKELGADSVESIVFHGREAAFDKDVLRSLGRRKRCSSPAATSGTT